VTDDDRLPTPAPAFAAHFTDPLYDDPASELAPFGTDEGADLLHEWAGRRDELGPSSTLAHLLEEEGASEMVEDLDLPVTDPDRAPDGLVDAATTVVGAGFTLLRLTGRLDVQGLADTRKAVDVLLRLHGEEPELVRQRDDLRSWPG